MIDKQNLGESAEGQEVNLLEVVSLLLKRKMLIFSLCAVVAVLTAGYSMMLPSVYSATAKVLPPQKEGGAGLSAMLGQMGAVAGLVGGGVGANANEVFVSILKSRTVGEAVIAKLQLAKVYKTKTPEDTWDRFNDAVKVQAGKDGIVSITAEATDPKLTALIANRLADELGNTLIRLNLTKAGTERVFLEKRLEMVKKDLNRAENDLKVFSLEHKLVQMDGQAKATMEGLSKVKLDIANKEVQLAVLRSSQTENSFEVKALEAGIRRLNADLAKMSGSGSAGEAIPSLGSLPGIGLEYARKMRELKTQEALFEQLTKQYEMAKMSEAKDSSTIQVLDEARVPENRIRPRRSSMVMLATFMAFFASILLVFVLNYFDKMSDEDKKIFADIKKQTLSLKG